MQAGNQHHASGAHGNVRPGRAERRAAERQKAKEASHAPKHSFLGWPAALSAGLIVLIAFAFYVYASTQGSNPKAAAPIMHHMPLVSSANWDPLNTQFPAGAAAPDFTLKDDTGIARTLSAQRGHPVVLEFFATWCPVCHRETYIMHDIAKSYAAKGVRLWAIVANPYGRNYEYSHGKDTRLVDRTDLSWYVRNFNVNYAILLDPKFKTVNHYGASGYPTIYVIDKKGKVAFSGQSAIPYKDLSTVLNRTLAR